MAATIPLTLDVRTTSRTIVESQPILQGVDETVVYDITTTTWGTPVGVPTLKVYDITGGRRVDVTGDVTTGACSAALAVISTSPIADLTKDKLYRVEVQFVVTPSTYEFYFEIQAEL